MSLKRLAPYREDAGVQKHWKEIQKDQRKLYKEYKKRKAERDGSTFQSEGQKSKKPRMRARSRKNLKLKDATLSQ